MPPYAIWPDVKQRFADDESLRRINTTTNLIIPRRALFATSVAFALCLATLPVLSAQAQETWSDAVLWVVILCIGAPLLVVGVIWLIGARKDGKHGGGGGGCGGCAESGCGGGCSSD